MALNIKNRDVEKLLQEVVEMTGETKTTAVRQALEERCHRLIMRNVSHVIGNRRHFFTRTRL